MSTHLHTRTKNSTVQYVIKRKKGFKSDSVVGQTVNTQMFKIGRVRVVAYCILTICTLNKYKDWSAETNKNMLDKSNIINNRCITNCALKSASPVAIQYIITSHFEIRHILQQTSSMQYVIHFATLLNILLIFYHKIWRYYCSSQEENVLHYYIRQHYYILWHEKATIHIFLFLLINLFSSGI